MVIVERVPITITQRFLLSKTSPKSRQAQRNKFTLLGSNSTARSTRCAKVSLFDKTKGNFIFCDASETALRRTSKAALGRVVSDDALDHGMVFGHQSGGAMKCFFSQGLIEEEAKVRRLETEILAQYRHHVDRNLHSSRDCFLRRIRLETRLGLKQD